MLEYRAEGLCRNANHLSREELTILEEIYSSYNVKK